MILLQTLFVISGLGILVRFISNLASGDLLCIVNDLSDNKTNLDIRSFQVENCNKKCRCYSSLSGPFHISLSAYAAQEPGCKDKVKRCPQYFVSGFQQHPHSLHVGPRQLWSSVHVDAGWIHQSILLPNSTGADVAHGGKGVRLLPSDVSEAGEVLQVRRRRGITGEIPRCC